MLRQHRYGARTKTCFEMFVSSGGQDCPKTYYIIWLPAATGRNKFTILYISWLPAYSRYDALGPSDDWWDGRQAAGHKPFYTLIWIRGRAGCSLRSNN